MIKYKNKFWEHQSFKNRNKKWPVSLFTFRKRMECRYLLGKSICRRANVCPNKWLLFQSSDLMPANRSVSLFICLFQLITNWFSIVFLFPILSRHAPLTSSLEVNVLAYILSLCVCAIVCVSLCVCEREREKKEKERERECLCLCLCIMCLRGRV